MRLAVGSGDWSRRASGDYVEPSPVDRLPGLSPSLRREVGDLVALLDASTRLALLLSLGGVGQTEIARQLGISQGTVSFRLRTARAWLARCAPLRAELRGRPVVGLRDDLDALIVTWVAWEHRGLLSLSKALGRSQSTLQARWRELRRENAWPEAVGGLGWPISR